MKNWIILRIFLQAGCFAYIFAQNSPWTWSCNENNRCSKELLGQSNPQMSLAKCKLICGPFGSLWPKPDQAILGNSTTYFLPSNISYITNSPPMVEPLLEEAVSIFLNTLDKYHPKYTEGEIPWNGTWDNGTLMHAININITVTGEEVFLTLDTNESYFMRVEEAQSFTTSVSIVADTFFGARHALETLSQLINYEGAANALQIVQSAQIDDSPVYRYRGLMLDTSRNFFPVEDIQRTLDGMSYNKLNSFHWHMTDSHSFPMEFATIPNMSFYGAYFPDMVYTSTDVQSIVEYARVRGIRVIPELDAPAHEGNGWQWGTEVGLGELAVCVNKEPWMQYCVEPPCGQLNIANPNLYTVLDSIYKEILISFEPLEFFHYGGDEINYNCWNTTQEIVDWMLSNGNELEHEDYLIEWNNFQETVRLLLNDANGGISIPGILWTSDLTDPRKNLSISNQDYIIQIWSSNNDPIIGSLLESGFRVIFSNYDAWYLDCGFSAWVGEGHNWCSPYKGWQTVYDNDPKGIAFSLTGDTHEDLILGGESPLWSEQADPQSLDSRLWPRGAALAERLWSDPVENWEAAELRMIHNRQRMVTRGIQADRLQPEWCHQNEGHCYG